MPVNVIIETVALGVGLKPFFTADNTEPFVAVQPSAAPLHDCRFSRNGLNVHATFQRGDSVLILAGGCRLPYVYAMATLPLVIDLNWESDEEEPVVVSCGQLVFPVEGKTISFKGSNADGIFIPNAAIALPDNASNWLLCGTISDENQATVTQFYAPDSLNDEDLEIDVWLQIQHTLALTTGA